MTKNRRVLEIGNHLSNHHDDTVGVQEARGVPLVQSHLRFHRCPGAAAELVFFSLRAGSLEITIKQYKHSQTLQNSFSAAEIPYLKYLYRRHAVHTRFRKYQVYAFTLTFLCSDGHCGSAGIRRCENSFSQQAGTLQFNRHMIQSCQKYHSML